MASGKIAKRIIIEGFVQGVGFRPFICRLARRHALVGEVKNAGGAVAIHAEGTPENVAAFVAAIRAEAAPPAVIHNLSVAAVDLLLGTSFTATASASAAAACFLLPDLPTCAECLREIREPGRRRGHYFSNCTACGPRFSVARALPYDRINTSMAGFPLCRDCAREYVDMDDRRFHAETIACGRCGPELRFVGAKGTADGDDAFEAAVACLAGGGVIAIKGIGGYHFACIPSAAETVRRLKARDAKPFALMFRNPERIAEYCNVSASERELLLSRARPIVPLSLKRPAAAFPREVLMGDLQCGCLLPYSPLHTLLLERSDPLILTSANASGSAIMFRDEDALAFFDANRTMLSGVLLNNREIVRPVEDSVVVTTARGEALVVRRARGYAPAPIRLPVAGAELVALGGDLKAAFCLTRGDAAYVSQYFGDLEDAAALANYTAEIERFKALFRIRPRLAVCDAHPGYFSSDLALGLGLPVLKVQHHHAHIASVIGEHAIAGPVIGVAFDGAGYGEDGSIWGGEFLYCEGSSFRRLAHLDRFTLIGGDQAARDAAQTAACLLLSAGLPVPEGLFRDVALLRAAMEAGVEGTPCSSMGRFFDALAAILGLASRNEYEGQCAIALQQCAEKAAAAGVPPMPLAFATARRNDLPVAAFVDIAEAALRSGPERAGAFALGFHHAVAAMVSDMLVGLRAGTGCGRVALSGGVFQNQLLLELCRGRLEHAGFSVFFNCAVPPNDGGLALGQALLGSRAVSCGKG